MITPRLVIAAAVVLAVITLALLRARRRARYAPTARYPEALDAPVTAVYFTSRLCAECKETRGIIRAASPQLPIVEVSVHERPDLARRFRVSETPTLLLFRRDGTLLWARAGNPSVDELCAALQPVGTVCASTSLQDSAPTTA